MGLEWPLGTRGVRSREKSSGGREENLGLPVHTPVSYTHLADQAIDINEEVLDDFYLKWLGVPGLSHPGA